MNCCRDNGAFGEFEIDSTGVSAADSFPRVIFPETNEHEANLSTGLRVPELEAMTLLVQPLSAETTARKT